MLFDVSIDGGLVIQRRQFLQYGIVHTVFFGRQNIDVVQHAVAHLLMKQRIFGDVQAAF